MPTTAFTLRLDPEARKGLNHLSKLLGRPKNKLANDAVKLYVRARSRELIQNMESTIQQLRGYQQADPDFEQAIAGFVDVEAKQGGKDPTDGKVVETGAVPGAIQSEIRTLLHA